MDIIMAKKRTAKRRSSKKKTGNSFAVIILIIVVLALLAFGITYVMTNDVSVDDYFSLKSEKTEIEAKKNDNKVNDTKTEKVVKEQNVSVAGVLEGTWVSNNDGAMLTINGKEFTIEQPSVDSPQKIKGTVVYGKNTITFINNNEKSDCGIRPGEYSFVVDNDGVTFSLINDTCKSRAIQLECNWFQL